MSDLRILIILIALLFQSVWLAGNFSDGDDSIICDSESIESIKEDAFKLKYKNTQKALELAKQSLELSNKYNFTEGIISSEILLAEIYLISADYEKALEYYLSVFKKYEESNDQNGVALISNDIGRINMLTGNYEKALFYYEKALKLNMLLNNVNEIASNYSNIGQIHVLKGSINKGLSHYLVAYMITDSLQNIPEMISLLNNIGNGYLKLKKFEQALASFKKELDLSQIENNSYTISRAYYNIGNTYFLYGDHADALTNISKGLKIAYRGDFNRIIQDGELILSKIYESAGNFAEAYRHHKIYKSYSDSILNEEKLKQVAELQAKYDLDKKEKEIQLLRLQNAENGRKIKRKNNTIAVSALMIFIIVANMVLLIRANRKYKTVNLKLSEQGRLLKELNQQKDRFFSFVMHNLNNPFHTIWGFSELLLKYADKKDTEKMVRYSKYIYDSSYGIKQILGNLLEWTTLQNGNYEYNPSSIELESLIKDTLELNGRLASEKKISFTYENIINKYAFADRRMVYTILQNLISNALKFTPLDGKVKISAKCEGRFLEISVSDTGVGMSEPEIKKLFKMDDPSSNSSKGSGMGLIICKELVMKNGGEIRITSQPGIGSTFTFTLPLPESEVELTDMQDSGLDSFIKEIKESLEYDKLSNDFLKEMNSLLPAHEYLSRAISVEDLKDFSKKIIKHSEDYNVEPLNLYGKKLYKYAEKLQFDKILKILPEFPQLIREAEVKKSDLQV